MSQRNIWQQEAVPAGILSLPSSSDTPASLTQPQHPTNDDLKELVFRLMEYLMPLSRQQVEHSIANDNPNMLWYKLREALETSFTPDDPKRKEIQVKKIENVKSIDGQFKGILFIYRIDQLQIQGVGFGVSGNRARPEALRNLAWNYVGRMRHGYVPIEEWYNQAIEREMRVRGDHHDYLYLFTWCRCHRVENCNCLQLNYLKNGVWWNTDCTNLRQVLNL